MSTIENESNEVVVADKPAEGGQKLLTIEPKKYVALVFEPFAKQFEEAKGELRSVEYDIKTTAGMNTAVKLRATFRDIRVASEKARKLRKAPIIEIGKLLDGRQGEIEATLLPLETLFDEEIKAEEQRKEEIKAAARRAEEARQAALQAKIDEIKNIVVTMAGKTAAKIDRASVDLDFREITFDEFGPKTGEASLAKSKALEQLGVMHDEALAREKEAARVAAQLEADRIERERVAEVNRIESERLAKLAREIDERNAAARAEQERKDSEAAAARAAADREAADRRAEEDRAAAEARAAAQRVIDQQAADLRAQLDAQEEAARVAREAEEARAAAERAEIERVEREAREAEQRRLDEEAAERRRIEDEEAAARRIAEEAAHAAEQKLRDAAPLLLAALKDLLAYGLKMSAKHEAPAFQQAREAIAAAE